MTEHAVTATGTTTSDDRPALAIVVNSHTPYRLQLHRRIVKEIPEVRLWTLYTHENDLGRWGFDVPADISPVSFGPGQAPGDEGSPRHALREWRKGGRIIRWLKQQRISAVLVSGYADAGRVRIIAWCQRNRIPVFIFGDSNIRGDRATGVRRLIKRTLLPWILRKATAVLACGSLGRQYFERYGVSPDRIFYWPYEPDYDAIARLPPVAVDRVRERFKLDPRRRRLLYSGRLVPVKRVDLLVDAFVHIAPERPEWDLVIAGSGPERSSLVRRIPPDLESRVLFTGFLESSDEVAALNRLCDVLVLPSEYEPWAVVVNEAAASGLAIVASDVVGAAAELVEDGVNGRLFPPSELESLIEALRDATGNDRTDAMKAASSEVIANWRQRGDPVEGLRSTLRACGVLAAPPEAANQ